MTGSQRRVVIGILILLLILIVGIAAWFRASSETQDGQPVTAFITHFRPGLGRIQASMVTVTAKTQDGISGRDVISANEVLDRHCKVGDRVAGKVVGITLVFDASTCEPTRTQR